MSINWFDCEVCEVILKNKEVEFCLGREYTNKEKIFQFIWQDEAIVAVDEYNSPIVYIPHESISHVFYKYRSNP